jgi:hypothetical protein
VTTQQELLALHGYMLEGARALGEAEKRMLTALGQASTLGDHERAESAHELLTEHVEMIRRITAEISAWLDGPAPAP